MIALKTVLCPVDFLPATPRQVDLAADLCRAFGARLVLHHNLQSMGIGASVGWMWNADHHANPQAAAEAKLQECLSRVPEGVHVESIITQGPTARTVLTLAEAVDADLVLLTTHGTMSEEHASITERMIDEGRRAVLVLHESSLESRTPHFASQSRELQVVVAPTDLSSASRSAIEVGFDLARALPIELHLLHFLPKGRKDRDAAVEEKVRNEMRALVPPDVAARARIHVEHGDPAEGIPLAAQQLSATCIVMGELASKPFWRWFTPGPSRAVLQQARCPVWYVPAARAS